MKILSKRHKTGLKRRRASVPRVFSVPKKSTHAHTTHAQCTRMLNAPERTMHTTCSTHLNAQCTRMLNAHTHNARTYNAHACTMHTHAQRARTHNAHARTTPAQRTHIAQERTTIAKSTHDARTTHTYPRMTHAQRRQTCTSHTHCTHNGRTIHTRSHARTAHAQRTHTTMWTYRPTPRAFPRALEWAMID